MTAATIGGLKRPPLTHAVKMDDGSEHEIKLTYGLFQDLQRSVPDPALVVDILTADPEARDYIVRRCMTPTKKMVKNPETELVQPDELDLSDPDEMDGILQWVAEHMLYFFATSAGGLKRLSVVLQTALKNREDPPAPSMTGSQS